MEENRWLKSYAVATWIMALFTFVLVGINCYLANLAKTANETEVANQRAYMNIDFSSGKNAKIINSSNQVVAIQLDIIWNNSGNTPTKFAVAKSNSQPWASDLPKAFDFKDLDESQPVPAVIGPRSSGHQSLTVPLNYFIDVIQRKYHLYLWGWVAYRDAFPATPIRLTEYCAELVGVRADKSDALANPENNIHWGVIPCPTVAHNCYDDGCTDYQARIKEVAGQFPQLKLK